MKTQSSKLNLVQDLYVRTKEGFNVFFNQGVPTVYFKTQDVSYIQQRNNVNNSYIAFFHYADTKPIANDRDTVAVFKVYPRPEVLLQFPDRNLSLYEMQNGN